MQKPRYLIRTMRRGELDIAVAWATAEGWNPGRHVTDPDGYLFHFCETLGERAATAEA